MALSFVTEVPASISTGKRGRPETFSETLQTEVKAAAGKWALLQSGVRGRSRATALRRRYADTGFEFRNAVTGHDGEGDKAVEIVDVYVRYAAVESTPDPAPAEVKVRAPRKPKA